MNDSNGDIAYAHGARDLLHRRRGRIGYLGSRRIILGALCFLPLAAGDTTAPDVTAVSLSTTSIDVTSATA
eukprot:4439947-Prymnesium_polylepis.1